MAVWNGMLTDVTNLINDEGQQIHINHYNVVRSASDYDDSPTVTLSGTTWGSGLIMAIKANQGSQEAALLEQGKIKASDVKIYLPGSYEITDTMKVMIGSPTGDAYSITGNGVTSNPPVGTVVYKLAFLRYLTNGSLSNE